MSENVPQAKKGLSGCLIAVIVVSLCISAAIAVALYLAARSPLGQKAMASRNLMKTILEHSANAPGVAELKQSLCSEGVLIIDLDDARTLMKQLDVKQNPFSSMNDDSSRIQIVCNPGSGMIPTCAQVAEEWLKAVKTPAGNFGVNVSKKGQSKANCDRLYSPTGVEISKKKLTR
jgi:hypothetical protein